jgi:hypothetical protein
MDSSPTLVVQVPAYNEAENLATTLADIPREIPGVGRVLVLVIDDGSTDDTARVANEAGADKVVRFPTNRGLALAFQRGLQEAVAMGADVIVNFDGDNQYPGDRIPDLAAPILAGTADMVLGERDMTRIAHFSGAKKFLQRFGTRVVSRLSGVTCGDATTGFRAFSRETAQSMYVASMFTYTLETLFWAGSRKLSVQSVTIETRPKLRESRLFGSSFEYVLKSMVTIFRTSLRYRATALLAWLSLPLFLLGCGAIFRFLLYHFFWEPDGTGHVQSLVFAAVFVLVGVVLVALGIQADSTSTNRRLLEEILTLLRKKDE